MPEIFRRDLILVSLAGAALAPAAMASAPAKPRPATLLNLSHVEAVPSKLSDSTLIIIDAQNEYRHGPLALDGIETAVRNLASLLKRARVAKTPIIHIAQIGDPGEIFDRKSERGQFMTEFTPGAGEAVLEKPNPNSFAETTLNEQLGKIGRKNLIVAGFMTHMCVSSTVRAGYDLGYRLTIAADATATRALPTAQGGAIPAAQVHAAALAALGDFFAAITTGDAIGV